LLGHPHIQGVYHLGGKNACSQPLLIFILLNYISVYQLMRVILQKPFKHGFKQEFNVYTTNNIDKQLDVKEAKDVKLHFHMFVLRPLLYLWLFQKWRHVNQPNMIKRGWLMCGLEQAFNKTI